MRRITPTELWDRARQAVRSRAEGVPWIRNWVLPNGDCFAADAGASAALARLSEMLPLGRAARGSADRERLEPDQVQALRRSADDALAGRFDLLGMRRVPFGDPVDWHLEPTSGIGSPLVPWKRLDSLDTAVTGDKKVIWELNRHQHLLAFGRAFRYTGDERYAEALVEHIVSWIRANPPALGINWVSSVDIAFRCMSWLWALALVRGWSKWTSLPLRDIARALHLQGCHIETYLSTYSSPNTHLTGEALGLYYLGTCLRELQRAERWRHLGRSILLEQLDRQIRPDGVYFEQSTWYQRYTADIYMHFILLARRAGDALPERVAVRLAGMLDYLMWITRPDGTSPSIGDDDGGRLVKLDERGPSDWRAVLASGAVLFGRADYKHVARTWAEETRWLLGPDAAETFERLPSAPPDVSSRAFVDGGCYVMRSGWAADSNYLLVDCGPHGTMNCGHAHADALAIEVAALGTSVLIDPGTFTYTGSAEFRDLFRSTPMHNSLTIDGLSSSVPAGPFKWRHVANCTMHCWHDHPRFTYFEGSHDGYRRLPDSATHTRTVLFANREYWLMLDRVDASGEHEHAIHFQLAPGIEATLHRATQRLEARAQSAVLDVVLVEDEGAWDLAGGLVSPCYAAKVPAWHGTYTTRARGPVALLSVLFPRHPGELPPEIRNLRLVQGKGMVLTTPRFQDFFLWSCRAVPEAGLHATDFESVWVRRSAKGERFERITLLHGTRFSSDDVELTTERPVEFVAVAVHDRALSIDVAPPVGIRVHPRANIDHVVLNGQPYALRPGEELTLMKHPMPTVAVPRERTGFCGHVRH